MKTVYTEEQIIAEVPGLDNALLVRFLAARIVIPVERPAAHGRVFQPVDVARLRLACELCESFELQDDALGMVMELVDQLHGVRAELRAVLEAVGRLPDETRQQVAEGLKSRLSEERGD